MHIPFKGAGPGIIDVIGGHTKAINATISTLSPHIRGGKLRALGVSGTKRSAVLPDVPTIEEGGVPGYEAGNWIGLAAPAGTPAPSSPGCTRKSRPCRTCRQFQKHDRRPTAPTSSRMGPAEFAAFMDNEMAKWGRVVKQAGIKAQ